MEIKLDKNQYLTLLKLIHLGEWLVNSHKSRKDKDFKDSVKVQQLIYSFAKENGLEKWIEQDAKGIFRPTCFMEDEMQKITDQYDEQLIALINK